MGKASYCVWNATRAAWECVYVVPPVAHWSATVSEAQVRAMQAIGPDPTHGPGHRAYAEWLRMINPPCKRPARD